MKNKTLHVSEEVRNRLMRIKYDQGFVDINEVITKLLERYN